jgi:hypothetical protein
MLLIFYAGLPRAPSYIILRLLGGGSMVGDGARGVCSGVITGIALFLEFCLSLLICVLGGTPWSANCTAPINHGRQGNVPSLEIETLSFSPLFRMDAACASRC